MFLQRLYVKDFRSFSECTVDFIDGVNIIVGDNGQGKTSLLEALFFCITATSFRTPHVKELIRFSQKGLFVEARFQKQGVNHVLTIAYDGQKRRVSFNHAPCQNATELLGMIPGVACTPEDIELVQGAPSDRRRFLDLMLAQQDHHYVHHLRRYNRALKQRNVLLKQKKPASLFCWEAELAQSGAYLAKQRMLAIVTISERAKSTCQALIGQDIAFEIGYDSFSKGLDTLDAMQKHLEHEFVKKREQEMDYGMTLTGPHRDDLDIRFQKKSAKDFASIGQKRLIGHSLRLAEWYFLKERCEEEPLMIVDDFATSLDSTKTGRLAQELGKLGQVFLTSTDMPESKIDKPINRILLNHQESCVQMA